MKLVVSFVKLAVLCDKLVVLVVSYAKLVVYCVLHLCVVKRCETLLCRTTLGSTQPLPWRTVMAPQ